MFQSLKKGTCLAVALALLTTLFTAVSPVNAQPKEEEGYRNVALRRAAYHSTATDYNQTGHLVTDGITPEVDIDAPEYSDQYGDSPSAENPSCAFDGNSGTKWLTFHQAAWLQLKFPGEEAYTATSYSLTTANDQPGRDPKAWTVEGSNDGVNFDVLDKQEGITWSERYETKTFQMENDTSYRYYRLNITENSGDNGEEQQGEWIPGRIQLGEFDLFNADGESVVPRPGQAGFNSEWVSKSSGEQYVYIDLGAQSSIDKVVVDWGDNYASQYEIQVSDDAESWNIVYKQNAGQGGTEECEFDTVQTQYVRLLCQEAVGNNYGVYEMEVYGVNDLHYSVGEMPEPEADGTQYLRGGNWKVERVSQVGEETTGETLSQAGYDDSSWLPATVPGTVLWSYLQAGAIPDPNVSDQQLQISDSYFTADFWYRNSFVIPESQEGQRTWLNFDAINWKADVYFNGQNVGRIEGAFIQSKFDVTDLVNYGGENYLAVYIHKNDNPGAVTEQTIGSAGANGGVLGYDNPTLHASIGWDWVPTIRGRNIGIYQDVYVSYTQDARLVSPWVITDLDLNDEVTPIEAENLALNKAASASSVEDEYNGGQNVVKNAVDGDSSTRWSSKYADDQWFQVDFGEPTTFSSTRIQWESSYASNYTLQYSNDGETWTDILTEDNCKGGVDQQYFDQVTARYLRIQCGDRASKYGVSFWEFEVYDMEEPTEEPEGPDFSKADLTVKTEVSNCKDEASTVTVSGTIQPGNLPFSQDVNLEPNETKEVTIDGIVMEDPELWWPNTYGDQYLYTCNIQVSEDGQVSDDESFQFGVREFSYSEGSPLEIYCNGTRIIGRGGNWGMDDSNVAATAEDYDTKVRLHAEANLTMIRNWVGQTGNEEFYKACDKYGILVFDDFWLANPSDGPNPNDEEMFMENAVDKIKRVRRYASVCFYCGRNEGNPPETLNKSLEEATVTYDGTRHYIPHSASGTVSGYGPYAVQDPKYYFNNAPMTLHSERGLPNIPAYESMVEMLGEDHLWPIDNVWGLHDFTSGSAQNGNKYQQEMKDYGSYNSLEEFVRIAQMVNYENHKALFEATLNKSGNGMLMWMSQSAWPSMVWQTYDYYYDTNGGYFGLKQGNQPINAIWNCTNEGIVLVNYTPNDLTGLTAYVNVYDIDGNLILSESKQSDIESDSTVQLMTLQYPEDASDIKFIRTRVEDADGNQIADDFYWTNTKEYQGYEALNDLPEVKLTADYQAQEKVETTCYYTVNLQNNSDDPALMIRLKTTNDLTGERVLPTYYSDNYISLMPGESKQITVEFDEKYLNGGQPVFSVEGWNIVEFQIGEEPDPYYIKSFNIKRDGQTISQVSAGKAYAEVEIVAQEDSSFKLNPVIALYKDGKLVDVETNAMSGSLQEGKTGAIPTLSVVIPDEEDLRGYEVKAFLLGGDSYAQPLQSSRQLEPWSPPNLALDAVAEASSEENKQQSGGADHSVKNVNDGDSTTRWASDWKKDPQWVQLDFGKPIEFSQIVLQWEAAYATKYVIQISDDGERWTDLVRNDNSKGGTEPYTFEESQTARYIRVQGEERAMEKYGYSLYEIQVYQ
ncbi:discoidin domain-containing protein [Solibaculum mannosilyticum]|uniref:discoidin domain-containing protein n=1 Tax=Solibaculum mannosilyticum TaxID=2780922 RepID=UPI0034C02AD6